MTTIRKTALFLFVCVIWMAGAVLFLVLWNVLETAGKRAVAQSKAQTSPYIISGRVNDNNGNGLAGVVLTASLFAEPNDSCADARPVHSDGVPQEHRFESIADVDWVYFDMVEGEQYLVDAQGVDTDDIDLSIRLYTDCNSAMMPITNPSFSPAVRYQFRAPKTGRIYVRLENDNKVAEGMQSYRVSVRNLSTSTQPGLLILVAGRLRTGDPLQSNINQIATDTYNLFLERGYEHKDIYLIAADFLPNRDAPADIVEVRNAITTWAREQGAGSARPVTIYMVDHGDTDKFYLDGVRGQIITPGDLDSWLTALETARPGVRINIFYEACFSGSFIQPPQSISKAGRVIATSTTGQNLAYASRTGAEFSDLFLSGLRQGNSLLVSFENAAEPIGRNFLLQEPWLDDNGNGIPNDPGDGQEAARRGFNFADTLSDIEGDAADDRREIAIPIIGLVDRERIRHRGNRATILAGFDFEELDDVGVFFRIDR